MESLLADKDKKPHYHGHRQRLRERFLKGGPDSLPGYELLELILFGALRQGDVKPLAKRLIDQFGSLAAVFSAEISALENAGLGETTIATLKATQAAALHLSRAQLLEEPILSSWQALLDYCRAAMGHDRTEAFRILFLDRRNRLIKDEVQQRGTVDHTPVYPREVVKRALELGATALILVHNHPSGDATPSQADIEMTKKIAAAADPLGIVLHDHLIMTRSEEASFKAMGLL
ncbi:MAG: DNA repair protein RadC [Rhodospirillaceae bacterium]|nr:DNA repair protein RadC [Rhodospirillaceae bacterium]MBT5082181.1 DNA repair protein RadC [Rhodospirillaceae bacterium]MBT5526700.1 DNA repair protein RadC [Rhodospirillaceae bacterium]MBT5878462.1 DNA repair protein RadC [Rhodospirillaceae bacterium]MBT6589770.1 DNA repair protein RadC [Rhodospirillaceae bacterium]